MAQKWQLPAVDPAIALRDYEERMSTLSTPRHRQMLQTLIDHVRTVLIGDLEGVMATMSPEPQFSTWSARGDVGPKGADVVRAGYAGAFARPGGAITNQVNHVEHLVVDDHTIALALVETRIWPALVAKEKGVDIDRTEGYVAVRRRCAVIIPFDEDARIRGELNYGFGWPSDPNDWEPVEAQDLSPEYLAWLQGLERTKS